MLQNTETTINYTNLHGRKKKGVNSLTHSLAEQQGVKKKGTLDFYKEVNNLGEKTVCTTGFFIKTNGNNIHFASFIMLSDILFCLHSKGP